MPSRLKVQRLSVERLSAPRYVTIVLRLLLDRRVRLVQGEVAGVAGSEPPRRFRGWRSLVRAVRALLADARPDDKNAHPDDEDGGETAAGGAYLVRGSDVRLVMANRAAEAVWGAAWPEGEPMAAFLRTTGVRYFEENGQPLAPEDLATFQAVRSGQSVRQRREVVRRPNGTRLPILVSVVALDPDVLRLAEPREPAPSSPAPAPSSPAPESPYAWAALVLLTGSQRAARGRTAQG
jgi:hypothetical protein